MQQKQSNMNKYRKKTQTEQKVNYVYKHKVWKKNTKHCKNGALLASLSQSQGVLPVGWCEWVYLGLSENNVPPNLMVHHHFLPQTINFWVAQFSDRSIFPVFFRKPSDSVFDTRGLVQPGASDVWGQPLRRSSDDDELCEAPGIRLPRWFFMVINWSFITS